MKGHKIAKCLVLSALLMGLALTAACGNTSGSDDADAAKESSSATYQAESETGLPDSLAEEASRTDPEEISQENDSEVRSCWWIDSFEDLMLDSAFSTTESRTCFRIDNRIVEFREEYGPSRTALRNCIGSVFRENVTRVITPQPGAPEFDGNYTLYLVVGHDSPDYLIGVDDSENILLYYWIRTVTAENHALSDGTIKALLSQYPEIDLSEETEEEADIRRMSTSGAGTAFTETTILNYGESWDYRDRYMYIQNDDRVWQFSLCTDSTLREGLADYVGDIYRTDAVRLTEVYNEPYHLSGFTAQSVDLYSAVNRSDRAYVFIFTEDDQLELYKYCGVMIEPNCPYGFVDAMSASFPEMDFSW